MFEALLYKPEGRGFDSRLGHLGFFNDLILLAALWPSGDSTSNRNKNHLYLMGINLVTFM